MKAITTLARGMVVAGLAWLPNTALPQDTPAITPYRPSVSNPAQLPAPGQVELEAGWLAGLGADGRRNSIPVLIKYAFSDQWGMLLGADAYVAMHQPGEASVHGGGDTTIVLKRAFAIDAATALGLELGAKLPTAGANIGTGHADYTVNAIVSRDVGKLHLDANLNLTRPGLQEAGAGGAITGLSAALSTPINEHWSALAELSGTRQRGANTTSEALMGLAYSPTKRLTLDLGMSHSLHAPASGWAWFTGVVLPLGQLR